MISFLFVESLYNKHVLKTVYLFFFSIFRIITYMQVEQLASL